MMSNPEGVATGLADWLAEQDDQTRSVVVMLQLQDLAALYLVVHDYQEILESASSDGTLWSPYERIAAAIQLSLAQAGYGGPAPSGG